MRVLTSKQQLAARTIALRARDEALRALHLLWMPHEGQIEAGLKIFANACKIIFLQCGRNFGKTQFLVYCCVRFAILNPNSHVYLIGPERKQQAEIVWHSKLLHNMIPKGWIADPDKHINKTELRITLKNGSFIKIDGADDPESLRGYKPHFLACDEFKDWKKEAYDAMEPNLLAKRATVVIAGTPPDTECFFTSMADFVSREMDSGNERYFFMKRPTHTNPHLDKTALAEIERAYADRGESGIFKREYLAEFVPGGANAIFGTFSRYMHVRPYFHIQNLIQKDRNKLIWVDVHDPASTSIFGSLFIGYNENTKKIYITNEIYERDKNKTSTSKIWPRVVKIKDENCGRPDRWYSLCDNHEQWFINEVRDSFGYNRIIPTNKQLNKKEQQISLIKDLFIHDMILISEECKALIFEIENYVSTPDGQLRKQLDHLIDCLRYFLVFVNYTLPEEPEERKREEPEKIGRPKSFEEDYQDWLQEKHPERAHLNEEYIDIDTFLY